MHGRGPSLSPSFLVWSEPVGVARIVLKSSAYKKRGSGKVRGSDPKMQFLR